MATDIAQVCEAAFANGFSAEAISQCPATAFLAGGALNAIILAGILIFFLFLAAAYVYYSITWYTIAKKLNHKKPWLAWIPLVNISLVLQLGGFHWAWIFLLLLPVIGWIALFVIGIVAKWFIFEKRNYPGWLSLGIIIPEVGWILHTIILGFVAWADRPRVRPIRQVHTDSEKVKPKTKARKK